MSNLEVTPLSAAHFARYPTPAQLAFHTSAKERRARLEAAVQRSVVALLPAPVVVPIAAPQPVPEPVRLDPLSAQFAAAHAFLDAQHVGCGRVKVRTIQQAVAARYNVTVADMLSKRRHLDIMVPRHVAIYLCRELTPQSLPEISRKFGGRDHTTSLSAIKKIKRLLAIDADLGTVVAELKAALSEGES